MSAPASLLHLAMSAVSNRAAMPVSMCMSLQIPETDESHAGKVAVVGRYRTRWLSPGRNYCVSPPLSSAEENDGFPDFPVPVLPPISLTLADESEAQQEIPMRQVVHRWRTEWVPMGQEVAMSPPLSSRDEEFADFPLTPAPPPSLMPIPDGPFYDGPPQATAPSLIPIYHRSRTEWIRRGDNFALTPGFNLEEFNAHVCEPRPAISASWTQASAWALAQKSSETPKKE